MTDKGYFSAARDQEVIEAGGFFCLSCLVGKSAVEQSDDPRSCISCFEILIEEASLVSPNRAKPPWVPVSERVEALPAAKKVVAKLPDKGIPPVGVLQHHGGRPKKEGEVHRSTIWRRQKAKEVQGVLVNA